jgi:hypothetical protein
LYCAERLEAMAPVQGNVSRVSLFQICQPSVTVASLEHARHQCMAVTLALMRRIYAEQGTYQCGSLGWYCAICSKVAITSLRSAGDTALRRTSPSWRSSGRTPGGSHSATPTYPKCADKSGHGGDVLVWPGPGLSRALICEKEGLSPRHGGRGSESGHRKFGDESLALGLRAE